MRACIPLSIKRTLKDKKGYALLVTLSLIVIFTILAFSLLTVLVSEVSYISNRNGRTKADYMAQAGIGHISAILNVSYDATYIDTERTYTVENDPDGETLTYTVKRDPISRAKFYVSGMYYYGGDLEYQTDLIVIIDSQSNITVTRVTG